MSNSAGPKIIRDASLILNLDAANYKSYPGTGTAWTDLTKNKLNATITGCTYSSGNLGSLVYNGTTSTYVTIPDSTTIRTQSFTIAAWVKFAAFNSFNGIICKPQTASGWTSPYLSFNMRINNNGTAFETSIGSVSTYSGTSTAYTFSTNIFYNLVMTYDGATIKGYINGSLITNANVAYTINYTSIPLLLGATGGATGGNTYGETLNGNMYSALIYNRALSATEVYNNFVANRGRFGV
jgi:Concanavalin A-like lectin/glucanases superfamily